VAIEITPDLEQRLAEEQVIWMTTTKTDGTPLPNPVWFLWNGSEFIVFTEPTSVKMKNLKRNPRLALNLNSDASGGSVAIFQAEANLNGAPVSEEEFNRYLTKYEAGMQVLGLTIAQLKAVYQAVRIVPTKFRTVI
jgi:PPOX class probable F420-dependent enzyme